MLILINLLEEHGQELAGILLDIHIYWLSFPILESMTEPNRVI